MYEVRREDQKLLLVVKVPRLQSALSAKSLAPSDSHINSARSGDPSTTRNEGSEQLWSSGSARSPTEMDQVEHNWEIAPSPPRRSRRANECPVSAVNELSEECISHRQKISTVSGPFSEFRSPCTLDGVDPADIDSATCSHCHKSLPSFKFIKIKISSAAEGAASRTETCIDCRLTTYVGVRDFPTWRRNQDVDMNDIQALREVET